MSDSTNWITRGKTIRELIKELETFENQNLEVKISIDDGRSFKSISLVTREHIDDSECHFCGLTNCEDQAEQAGYGDAEEAV